MLGYVVLVALLLIECAGVNELLGVSYKLIPRAGIGGRRGGPFSTYTIFIEVNVSPFLGLQASANLLQLAVNILRWVSDEVCKCLGDASLVRKTDYWLKGVGEDEMEQGLPLQGRAIGTPTEQHASQVEARREVLERPRIIK